MSLLNLSRIDDNGVLMTKLPSHRLTRFLPLLRGQISAAVCQLSY